MTKLYYKKLGWLVGFHGILAILGYLMLNLLYNIIYDL